VRYAYLMLKSFFTLIKEYYNDPGYNDLFGNDSRSGIVFYRYSISLVPSRATK
jgi:hypothetical protein